MKTYYKKGIAKGMKHKKVETNQKIIKFKRLQFKEKHS